MEEAGHCAGFGLWSPKIPTQEPIMSAQPSLNTPPRHLAYLDAARAIAALMVLFGHFSSWKYEQVLAIKCINFVFNSADAVSFFFVLSGMVLSYQYAVLGNSLDLRKYIINRFFRLFPAFFLTVFINALYWYRHDLNMPQLYDAFIRNKAAFWDEAVLIKSHVKFFIPGWTLTIELAASLFVPFLIVIGHTNRKLLWWMILTSLLVLRMTDQFIFHFTLGTIISFYFYDLVSDNLKEKKWYKFRYLILLAAIVLFSIRRIEAISPFGPTFYELGKYFQIPLFHYTALASFVFIVWLLRNQRVQRFLSHKILLFLGRISYGIYLMHWLVVVIIYDRWDRILPLFPNIKTALFTMGTVCFVVTIVLATLLYYAIELPFIRLGKRLTGKLKPSVIISAPVVKDH